MPPFPLFPRVSPGLKVGTLPINTTAASSKPRWWRRGTERERGGSHRYTLTYIHFHPADWILRWGLRPITSGGGVLASQWRWPPSAELLHCLHTVFGNHTGAERMRQTRERKGELDRWESQKTSEKKRGRRARVWGWEREKKIKKGKAWQRDVAQTDKNKRFFLPHLLLASVYYGAKPADRWRLILANVKEWISVPYLSLLISQPEAQAGLFLSLTSLCFTSWLQNSAFFFIITEDIKSDRMHCCCFANSFELTVFGDFHLPAWTWTWFHDSLTSIKVSQNL